MNKKNIQIDLPFDISSLLMDLKEIKQYLSEVGDNTNEEFENEISLLYGVIDNLEELVKGAKNPEKIDTSSKISLLAHFTLLQELMAAWEEEDFDGEDDESDECDEDDEWADDFESSEMEGDHVER